MSGYTEEEVREVAVAIADASGIPWRNRTERSKLRALKWAKAAMQVRDRQLGLVTVKTITADDVKKEG